jgi:fucose 4-O-acetylase-like acetyltransferase
MPNRDPYLDNLKLILVVFVVFTHFFFEYRSTPILYSAFNSMCVFIMPVFIFISGYLSKNIQQQRTKDITILLVPYFILEILNLIFTKLTHIGYGNKSILVPTYQNWYLLSLFFWRLIIPYFKNIKPAYAITAAFIVSICAGWVSQFGEFLSLYRTYYYLPVFVIGYYTKDLNLFKQKKNYQFWALGLLVLFVSIIGYLSLNDPGKADDLFYAFLPNIGYTNEWQTVVLRNAALFSGIICGFCFLFIIPVKHTFYTKYGRNTLYVYLFHMFLVLPIIRFTGVYSSGKTELIILISTILITMIFSNARVVKLLKSLIYPGLPDSIKARLRA